MKEFDKVIGYTDIKQELEQVADTLKNSETYAKLGVSAPKGLLLHGDPGLGKTLMATCLIEASGRPVYICRKDKPDGDFINAIKETFDTAKESAPSIVFLDDMDKFANEDENHRDAEEYVTVQSCIDGLKGTGVFVLATANEIHNLPRSLLRAGRFDRIIEVEAPQGKDAEQIIAHYLKGKAVVGDVDPKDIAAVMSGCSCAELETVINEAGLYAGFERSEHITMEHFMKACMRLHYGVTDPMSAIGKDTGVDISKSTGQMAKVIYHEAGHAVIAELLMPGTVALISAHGRYGRKSGFVSFYNMEEVEHTYWLRGRVIGSLGGMAATEQRFGIADAGAERDLDQAFDMVDDMVGNTCVCGFALHAANRHGDSEELQAKREQAIAAEVEKYYRKAKEILSLNREFLDKTAEALARTSLLTAKDVQRIKAECTIVPVTI